MAIAVHFSKEQHESFLECIRGRRDFKVPEAGWSGRDMLALAGALRFAALSLGPQSWYLKEQEEEIEHRELQSETLEQDIDLAINWHSVVAQKVTNEEYDDLFEAEGVCFVSLGEDGPVLHQVSGFKQDPTR